MGLINIIDRMISHQKVITHETATIVKISHFSICLIVIFGNVGIAVFAALSSDIFIPSFLLYENPTWVADQNELIAHSKYWLGRNYVALHSCFSVFLIFVILLCIIQSFFVIKIDSRFKNVINFKEKFGAVMMLCMGILYIYIQQT